MAYSKYSPDLLKFMYELAKMDRKLFGKELEDYIITRMGGLSARTMKRWIKYLKELESNYYSFDYVPKINFSTLGLCQVDVNLIEPVHRDISLLIPHNYYHIILKTKEIRDAQFVQYLIPYNSMDDLYDLHEEMIDQGLISDFTFFRIFDTFHIPSPYHEVIAPEGKLKFDKEIDNSFFIKKLELSRDQVRMDEEIKKNPFIIPVIFEGDKDTFPYNKIANILLTIRREHIKRYKGVERLMREPTKFTHRVKELQIGTANSDSGFYKYIYIYYKAMFEIENKESIHVFFKYVPEEFEDLLSNLSKKNLFILGFFGEREGERMIKLHLHSTFRKMFECLDQIKEFDPDMTYYIVDKEKSLSILDREHSKFFYWDLFDPERVEWKFERDLYREKIHDFKKAMDNGDYVEKETFTW